MTFASYFELTNAGEVKRVADLGATNELITQRMQQGNGYSARFQKVSKKEMAVPPVSKM